MGLVFSGRQSQAKIPVPFFRRKAQHVSRRVDAYRIFLSVISLALLVFAMACRSDSEAQRVRPRQMRDVPAKRLAFTFAADVDAPAGIDTNQPKTIAAIQQDFDVRRKDEALVLLRTVPSPDGQRALALYNTQDETSTTFHLDLYATDGRFLRNVSPPELSAVFQDSVVWSSDGGYIAFVARRAPAQPTPTPEVIEPLPEVPAGSPLTTETPMPVFAPVATFTTEQIYLCDRDGYNLRPLTSREGLIYFALAWAPDNHALAALACKESEWNARERELKAPSGRPRLVSPDGQERLLDDALAEAPPVWSQDSSKVATSFGVDIGIYDAAGTAPTQARIALRERLLTASAAFEEKSAKAPATPASSPAVLTDPASFNPIVRIEWPTPEKLYVETAYITFRSELIKTFSRWHLITLSPQAAVLKR
ncbi:MAG TPA: hypothetical protein VIU65_08230 [Pyrinomonadaceae bacterium]